MSKHSGSYKRRERLPASTVQIRRVQSVVALCRPQQGVAVAFGRLVARHFLSSLAQHPLQEVAPGFAEFAQARERERIPRLPESHPPRQLTFRTRKLVACNRCRRIQLVS